jgi:hypothetical protein
MPVEEQHLKKRGLASASKETRNRVARAGGQALHKVRGPQGASSDERYEVARKGGLTRGRKRRKYLTAA